jgi:uncharacterized protein DUF2510
MSKPPAPLPPRRSDPVAGVVLAGMVVGLVASLPVATSASDPTYPTVVPLVGMLVGAAIALVLALRAERRRPPELVFVPPEPHVRSVRAQLLDAGPPTGRADDYELGPGWHPDPLGGSDLRFWDGEAWTEHVWHPREREPRRMRVRAARAA